jgi:hypothetical protein
MTDEMLKKLGKMQMKMAIQMLSLEKETLRGEFLLKIIQQTLL